ncbi:hypothetical protein ACHAWO_009725 [Cyclotella atomus]|uniref:RAP domain-containing protein n=1 Tax=Cyclotella atomus TaxID=382360 RepID=A0ABD3PEK1_9STRA
MRIQLSLLHRLTCYCSRGSSLSRHISSSAAASSLSCGPSARSSHDAIRDLARWQHNSKRQSGYPIIWISIRQFSSRHTRSPRERSTRRRGLDTNDYSSIDDLLRASSDELNSGRFLPTVAVWVKISRLMLDRSTRNTFNNPLLQEQVNELFHHTMESLAGLKPKDLTTVILSMAKIAKAAKEAQQKRKLNNYHRAFGNVLLAEGAIEDVFDVFAMAADRILPDYGARHISNLAYAYALIGYNPQLDNQTLLGKIGDASIGFIEDFNGQDVSNMVWAFATLNVEHPALFQIVGDHIDELDDLESFTPQALANITWAYGTAGMKHPPLFEKVCTHINRLNDLRSFTSQNLANIVWAYATAGVQHAELFETVGDHINQLDNLKSFTPQALSNTVWAYATAGVKHRDLFEKVGTHINQLYNLNSFNPQDFANTVWAYATAEIQHTDLFCKIGDHIHQLDNLKSFTPQALANTVWAYATANELRSDLFEKIGNATSNRGDFTLFTDQAIANIAWAYTVANADGTTIFNGTFTRALLERTFLIEDMTKLYQWHLWQTEELSHAGLPDELTKWCYQAFVTSDATVSRFQKDVVHELKSIGLNPVEEYRAPSGYSIDALVETDSRRIGIEVDGPAHFNNRKPTATTMLKRRQISAIDKIPLVSVLYWEWDILGKDRTKKQQYLRSLVGI